MYYIVPLGCDMTTLSSSSSSTISTNKDVLNTEPPNSNGKTEWLDIALPILAGILVVVVAVGCYLRFR